MPSLLVCYRAMDDQLKTAAFAWIGKATMDQQSTTMLVRHFELY